MHDGKMNVGRAMICPLLWALLWTTKGNTFQARGRRVIYTTDRPTVRLPPFPSSCTALAATEAPSGRIWNRETQRLHRVTIDPNCGEGRAQGRRQQRGPI